MKQVLLIGCLWMLGGTVLAQISPRVIHFEKSDYQGQNQNWSLDQLPNQYVAIANSAGMLLYNGVEWETYEMPKRMTIRAVRSDSQGTVYVGGYGEFGTWSLGPDGTMAYSSLSHLLPEGSLQNEEIWNIIVTEQDVYFQSFGKIFKYSPGQSVAKPIKPPTSNGIMLLHRVNNHLYFQALGDGLYELLPDDNFVKIPDTDFLSDKKVVFILPHNYRGLLVGTERSGIYVVDDRGTRRWDHEMASELLEQNLNHAMVLRDGTVAIGTTLNGVYFLAQSGRLIWHINRENGLQNNTVLSMMEDITGNVWLGLDQGVDIVDIQSQLIYYTDTKGTLGTVYAALLFNDYLYLGTNQGLFRKPWTGDMNNFSAEPFEMMEGSKGQVWSLKIINGQVFGMHNDFAFRVQDDRLEVLVREGGWDLMQHPTNHNLLILSTYNGVSALISNREGTWTHEPLDHPKGAIRTVMADSLGHMIALSSFNGVHCFELGPETAKLKTYHRLDKKDGFDISGQPASLYRYQDNLIVRTESRAYRFDPIEATLAELQPPSVHLPDGRCKFLPGEGEDYFLVSDQRVLLQRPYDVMSFDLSLVKHDETITSLNGRHYLFGLDNGFALINRQASFGQFAADEPSAPQVYRVTARGKETLTFNLPLDGRGAIESQEFASHTRNIEISFGTIQFTSERLYRTKLEGYEREWTNLSGNTTREFNNLGEGNYQFQVQSQFGEDVGRFAFSIRPKWYQTYLARVGFTLSILLLIALLVYLQRRHLDVVKRRMELKNRRMLHEQMLKKENEQLQQEVRKNNGELANTTMLLVKKNQVLIEIKGEIKRIKSDIGARLPDKNVRTLNKIIDSNLSSEQDWTTFEANFSKVHDGFFKRLLSDYPELTNSDLKLASYLKMNLTSKQIAQLLNVSFRSLENKRYHLRKKLNLTGKDNLVEFIIKNY